MKRIYFPLALIVTLLLQSCIGQKIAVEQPVGAPAELKVVDDTVLDSPKYVIPDSLRYLVDKE